MRSVLVLLDSCQNKFVNLVHLVGFNIKKINAILWFNKIRKIHSLISVLVLCTFDLKKSP